LTPTREARHVLGELGMPQRQQYLFVCTNRRADGHPKGSCAEKGSEALLGQLKEALVKRGIHKDVVRACGSTCLDLCEHGISVLHEPAHVAYGNLTLADVESLADVVAEKRVLDRAVVSKEPHGVESAK
jgi:predicted metal-binding protein